MANDGEHSGLEPSSPDYIHDKQVHAPSTIDEDGSRRWIYPDRRNGPRASRRRLIAIGLIVFYFAVPWLSWNGRPLLRVDVLNQTAYIFGLVLKMTEYNLIFFIFAILGLVLFLVTTLRGRIWCGYACPQTVFIDWVIRPIEEWLEGPSLQRKKQDQSPYTPQLVVKKIIKQGMFVGVALLVANAFLGFFVDPHLIIKWVFSPPAKHPTAFGFVMFLTALMYFDLGWFREQFCAFLCPYARFQSALLDNESPSVTYLQQRGEPRGKGKGKGDCIDCGLCVRVCPTGIDIRNGLQLECIQCERCMDACDSVMTNLKRPLGLIKITAPNALTGASKKFWQRPRVYIYSALILAVAALGTWRVQSRDPLKLTFLRQQGTAYSKMPDGRLSNMFNLRVNNTTDQPIKLDLAIFPEADEGVSLICPQLGAVVAPFEEKMVPLIVVFPKSAQIKEITIRSRVFDQEIDYNLPIIH